MKLIVGLGNPGVKFKNNRHNVGFMIVDIFAIEMGLSWRYSRDWMCYFAKTSDYVLVKPSTYMNASGETVAVVSDYFGVGSSDILVVHDELDLEFGKIRLSFNGSSAGHKGVESVNASLGTEDFVRLRVGIGSPRKLGEAGHSAPASPDSDGKPSSAERYVLEDFSQDQKEHLPDLVAKCEEAIKSYLDDGLEATMNRFN
ncbi:aminoacyl-tRNA hydrolase [Candidatus Curtissbacteria bacterium]|nr:aminoacyl-tRNA hydrolase [Candidatus Curtissbacteria bacterium]